VLEELNIANSNMIPIPRAGTPDSDYWGLFYTLLALTAVTQSDTCDIEAINKHETSKNQETGTKKQWTSSMTETPDLQTSCNHATRCSELSGVCAAPAFSPWFRH
jgi:hypothetical protein